MYLNPYSGQVLHTQNMEEGFFPFILKGHFYLWLPDQLGQTVVGIITLLFFAMMITGITLWFSRNRKVLKNRVWFRWKAHTQWKRKNFDMHAIIGFYSFFVAIIFVLTGLVWGFKWFATAYYSAMGGKKNIVYEEPLSSVATSEHAPALDQLFEKLLQETPNLRSIEWHPPATDSSAIAVNTNSEEGTYWKTDYRYFDQNTLQELPSDNIYSRISNATFADKLMRMNYDIHTGGIFGLPGKIFMFLASLLIASLPVSGFLFWYGRTQKKKVLQDIREPQNVLAVV